jgi:hypothetical protein
MVSHKSDTPPTTILALAKGPRSAGGAMASSDAPATETTARIATPPDAVPSVFGPPVVAPLVANPQTACPLLSLARELRGMIYAYTFTPNFKSPVGVGPQTVELGDLAATVPSSAFLLTCRQVEQEAAVVFRAAQRSFCNDNVDFYVDLNDDWEDDDARKERHFEVLDLLDDTTLVPKLSDEHVNAMQNLAATVKSEIKTFEIRLIGRVHHNTKHWVMDSSSSTQFADDNEFTWTPLEIFVNELCDQDVPYLQSAERAFPSAFRAPSGRRYKTSARSDLQVKLAARRVELAANPPSARSGCIKKRQLDLLLQHCWIVYRARRAL